MQISKRSKFNFFRVGDIAWIPYEEDGKCYVVKGTVEKVEDEKLHCTCKVDEDVFDIVLALTDPVFFTKNEATRYYEDEGREYGIFEDNTMSFDRIREAVIQQDVYIKVGNEDGLPNGMFRGTLSKTAEAGDGEGSKLYYYHGRVEGAPKLENGREQEFDIILTNANIHAIGSRIAERYRVIICELTKRYEIGRKLTEQNGDDHSYEEGGFGMGFKEIWDD